MKAMKTILQSQRGISLIEVIVASVIAVLVSMGVVKINETGQKGMAKMSSDLDIKMYQQNVLAGFLSDIDTCNANLAGMDLGGSSTVASRTLTQLTKKDGTTVIATTSGTSNALKSWNISSIIVQPFSAANVGEQTGTCSIDIVFQKSDKQKKQSFGASIITHNVPVNCRVNASDVVESCSASSAGETNIWDTASTSGVGGYEYIFYQGASESLVGIGALASGQEMDSALQVNIDGPLWPVASTSSPYFASIGLAKEFGALTFGNNFALAKSATNCFNLLYDSAISAATAPKNYMEFCDNDTAKHFPTIKLGLDTNISNTGQLGLGANIETAAATSYPGSMKPKLHVSGTGYFEKSSSAASYAIQAAVYGKVNLTSSGTNKHHGVYGVASTTATVHHGYHYGVYGYATQSVAHNSGRTYGVYGRAGNGTNGWNYGTYGSLDGTQNGAGIFGTLGTAEFSLNDKYAGYFNGKTHVKGDFSVDGKVTVDESVAIGGSISAATPNWNFQIFDKADSSKYSLAADRTSLRMADGKIVAWGGGDMQWSGRSSYDDKWNEIGVNLNPGRGAVTGYLSTFGVNMGYDDSTNKWKNHSDGSSNGSAGIVMNYGPGWLGLYVKGTGDNDEETKTTILSNIRMKIESTRIIANVPMIYNNGVVISSDRRLKKDIRVIESPLEIIQGLNGYRYNWRSRSELPDNIKDLPEFAGYKVRADVGLIAQEVEAVLPELVKETKSLGGMKAVNYSQLVAVVIEGVKELANQIADIVKDIFSLKEKVGELESRVERLEQDNQAMRLQLCELHPELKSCQQ